MKKTYILIIVGLITIGCIIFGSYRHLGFRRMEKGSDNEFTTTGESSLSLQDFSSIKIDTHVTAIRIQEGDTFHIKSTYNRESLKPNCEVTDGRLNISQKYYQKSPFYQACKLYITVPSDTKLASIEIDSDVGDVEIRNLAGDKCKIDLNVGKIELSKSNFDEILVDNNVGEISISMNNDLSEYSLDLSTDVGEISVADNSYKQQYKSKANSSKRIVVDNNVGEIRVR